MRVDDRPTNLGLHALHSVSTLDIETQQDEGPELHHLGIRRTPSKTIIFFRPSDPEHPNNWSLVRALPRGQFLKPDVSAETEVRCHHGRHHVRHQQHPRVVIT
jgi:hypothetical protein